MNLAPSVDATARFERLAGYLAEDPTNPKLLAEACEAAISCGQHDRARGLIATAERLALDPVEWSFRRARLAIAARALDEAARLLQALCASQGEHPVLAHDLAFVLFLQSDFAGCRAAVSPWLGEARAAGLQGEQLQALQMLWLRASHRLHLLEEAMQWVREAARLQPRAKGVASLIAVDAGDFGAARHLADAALAVDPVQFEALVARASVALAQGDSAMAVRMLQCAQAQNPDDGRTWSTLGYASLHAGNLGAAQLQLERALHAVPGHIGTWHALGWARLLQGDRAGALQAFRRALEIDRNFAESHGAVGLVLALTGAGAEAEHHLDLADRLDPANVTGRYARALLAGEAGDLAALQRMARRLLDRPGFFGGRLSETVLARTGGHRDPPA